MLIRQMIHAIKVGIRSRLLICLLVVIAAYCFGLSHNPYMRLISISGVLVTSEIMIILWGTSFGKMLEVSFVKKGSISWQDIPELTRFKDLAESQGVKLNRTRPFGVRKDFDNAYANPITRQIVVGDLLLKKFNDGPLTALLGHEITHIKQNHYIKMLLWTLIVPTATAIPLLFIRVPSILFDLVFYATFFIVFLFISWHNEYAADSGAAEIAGVANTITLLKKIAPKQRHWSESETHPSIHSRILKLRKHHKRLTTERITT